MSVGIGFSQHCANIIPNAFLRETITIKTEKKIRQIINHKIFISSDFYMIQSIAQFRIAYSDPPIRKFQPENLRNQNKIQIKIKNLTANVTITNSNFQAKNSFIRPPTTQQFGFVYHQISII